MAFSVQARASTAMADIAAALQREIEPLGMTAAASGFVSGPRAGTPRVFHFANWPPDWIAHYMAEGYLTVDPLVRWARNCGTPIAWSDLFRLLPPRDAGCEAIRAAARFGFTEGLAAPMRAADNSLGLVAFGGPRDALSPAEQVFLAMLAREAFDAAECIDRRGDIGKPAPILSAREVECLTLLVRGHSDRRIGELLGLSEPTVRYHLGNAREKFAATSRTHLAALAVAQGHVAL
jgi:DNA-binding CsgD family transcriptional regulator